MKVLVVAPHMDDEVLGMGGTIAKHVERNDQVCVCIVANRAYGHHYLEAAVREQQEAARRAQAVLGYQELRLLDLPDEQLDGKLIDVIVPLEAAYHELQPEVVYTCHRGDINQDHRAVFEATMVVCRPATPHRPSRVLCYEVPSSTDQAPPFREWQFVPNLYERLSPSWLEKKVSAMQCYGKELREFPHPRSREGIITYARRRGMEAGTEAAEAFVVVRDIRA